MYAEANSRCAIMQKLRAEEIPTNIKVETVSSLEQILEQMTHICGQQLAVVTITLQFEQKGKTLPRYSQEIDRSIQYFQEFLRPLVRATDIVAQVKHTFYFFLLGATLQGATIVQSRLWNALLWRTHDMEELEIVRPQQMTLGYSAYPDPSTHITECLKDAMQVQKHFALIKGKSAHFSPTHAHTETSNESELSRQAQQFGIPYLSLLPRTRPASIQRIIHPKLAQELQCYPLGREKDVLTVAIANPRNRDIIDRLARETGLHIFPVLAPAQELQTALEQLI